jgi:hypothetical protein
MKIHTVNMFNSNNYVFIIVDIFGSVKKYHLYVNSLIAARKQRGCKSKKNTPEVHTLRYSKVRKPSFNFLGFLVFYLGR